MSLGRFTHARRCRAKATDLFRRGNTRLHLILACVLCLTFIVGTAYLADCVFCTIPRAQIKQESIIKYFLVDVATGSIQVLLAIFLDLPLLFGAAMIFIGTAYDEDKPLSTLFCAFASPRLYFRALGIMLRILIWPILLLGICFLLIMTALLINDVLVVCILFFLAALVFLSTLLYGANDAVLIQAYHHPDTRIRDLFRASHSLTGGRRLSQFRFRLSYVGWAFLAIPTLGLSLLLHTIPHFTLAYTLFLCEDSKQIQDSV